MLIGEEKRAGQETQSASALADSEHTGNPRPFLARTNHVGGSATAQQETQRIHDNRFTAAGFARKQIQARVKPHAQAFHYGVIFNRELVQHSIRL